MCKLVDFQLLIPPYLKTPGCRHLSTHQEIGPGKGGKEDGDVFLPKILKPGTLANEKMLPWSILFTKINGKIKTTHVMLLKQLIFSEI